MLKNMFNFFWKRKILLIVILVILSGVGYSIYAKTKNNSVVTSYSLATVAKGTIVSSISGTGQVSATNEIELKPKVSGDLTYFNLVSGQKVKKGDILARIDSSDAQKSVRDAKINLESAQLSLDKLKKAADNLSLTQAENSLLQAQESKQKAIDNLEKAYEDSYTAISNAFLDFPTLITGLEDILYGNDIGKSEVSISSQINSSALMNTVYSSDRDALEIFQKTSENDYRIARLKYNSNFTDYKNSTRSSYKTIIDSLLGETIETARAISQVAKSENNYLDAWVDFRTLRDWDIFYKVSEYQSDVSTYIGDANSNLSTLLSIQRSLQDYREAIVNADRTIVERQGALDELKRGTDAIDIKSQELSIAQRKNTLYDAQEKLADYTITAPFDGSIAVVNSKKGDAVSSATSLATIITDQKIAEISLNEVDVANIKTGQKSTLTFDAISDLSITGGVVEVDAMGTVSQGVVSYNIKIAFDTQDERIKPGMSVGASIIVDSRQDVIVVPSSAIKIKNGSSYVEIPDENIGAISDSAISLANIPKQQTIEIGLSDDASTEVISGLGEGDIIIIKTISSSGLNSSKSNSSSNNKTQSILGGNAGGPPNGMMR